MDKRVLFEEKIFKPTEIDCWLWLGGRTVCHYGQFEHRPKSKISAHRFSYLTYVGEIPDGKLVCHKCDNPPCVNPEHLFVGTYKDNWDDMISKNRWRKPRRPDFIAYSAGENNPSAKLTEAQVWEIRNSFSTHTANQLARKYGVSAGQIYKIKQGRAWRCLDEQVEVET